METLSDLGISLHNQANRLLKFKCSLPEEQLLPNEFSGTEAVSTPFLFSLSLISPQADLELKSIMGEQVLVSLLTATQESRYFHGHVIRFEHTGSDGGWSFYELNMGSWLEFLRHRYNCRVFQDMTIIDVIKEIFADYGTLARYEFKIDAKKYKKQTLVCQYNETDLNFVMRIMEEYGLYFYFNFKEDAHILKIEDDSTISLPMPIKDKIRFNVESGAREDDNISQFGSARQVVSTHFASKTFDFKKPTDPMHAQIGTNHQMGNLPRMEKYEYPGAYAFKDFQDGDRVTKLRIEAQEAHSKAFRGVGDVRSLTCGHAFELEDYYNLQSSVHDRTFFVLEVNHHANNNYLNVDEQKTVYINQFSCIRKLIPYRPALISPKPRIYGMQTATVVGASSEDIHCDEFARVLIQFHWDREGKFNTQSLCWVRVSYPWAGSQFGFISIPRVGTEVVISFLDGDPDRPIITGALYNQDHMPPWNLPANKTQSGILTRSSKRGTYENSNALRFEDKKGEEEIWIHAEKAMRIEVEASESHTVGADRSKTISKNETSHVKQNRTETVGGNDSLTVTGSREEQAKSVKITAKDSITLVCGGSTVEITPGGVKINGTRIDLNS